MSYLGLVVLALIVGAFVWRACSRGRFAVAGRRDAVFEIADTLVALAIARAIIPWGTIGVWWWYLAVFAGAVGIAALALRWGRLPRQDAAGRRGMRIAANAIHVVILAALLWAFVA